MAVFDHTTGKMRIITPQSYRQLNAPRAQAVGEVPIDALALFQQLSAMGSLPLDASYFGLSTSLLPGIPGAPSFDLDLLNESLLAATFSSDQINRLEDNPQFDMDTFLVPEYTSDDSFGHHAIGAISDSDALTPMLTSPATDGRGSMSMPPPPSPSESVAHKRKAARESDVNEQEPVHKRTRSISDVKALGIF